MIRAVTLEAKGARHGLIEDEVRLDYDQRHRRRLQMTGEKGLEFLLDLAKAARLRHGDALVLEDGRRVRISAAPEPLAEVRAQDPRDLLRLAWHIGNRHLPAMLFEGRIVIRRDHVIEHMVETLGGSVHHVEAPFDPEPGAYDGLGGHHHHAHDHDD